MMHMQNYRDKKETRYFILAVIFSVALRLIGVGIFAAMLASPIWLPTMGWTALFVTGSILSAITRMAALRSNMVRVGTEQFPEVEALVSELTQSILLKRLPEIYLMPHSTPTAKVMSSRKYDILIISTGLIDLVSNGQRDVARFMLARQLGRIALWHTVRSKWMWGAGLIPFIGSAYARACVRSADAVGTAMVPQGAVSGLCMIAAGPNLLSRMNKESYITEAGRPRNILSWLAEHLSTNPFLPGRIRRCLRTIELVNHAVNI